MLFDTDPAGLEAPARIAQALLAAALTSRVARLTGAPTDPDTFVRAHGMGALKRVLDGAVPLTEWLLERAIAGRVAGTGTKTISVEHTVPRSGILFAALWWAAFFVYLFWVLSTTGFIRT